jgi:hypothetical protein
VVLDAMEAAIGTKRDEGKARRLRLEHAQILTMGDLHRAVDLGGTCWFVGCRVLLLCVVRDKVRAEVQIGRGLSR